MKKIYNPEERRELYLRHRERYLIDAEYRNRFLEYSKKRYRENKEKILEWHKNRRNNSRREALEFVGGKNGVKCVKCGFKDVRAIQIDHVNGGGKKEINLTRDSTRYLKIIKTKPQEYQLLCANCNWIKRDENKEI